MKEFRKLVKIWWKYSHKRVAHFLETQCECIYFSHIYFSKHTQ